MNDLYLAIDNNDFSLFNALINKELIKYSENGENSFLILATDNNCLEICRLLIENGANVNYHSDIGETALGCAVINNNIELVLLLIESGAEINATDIMGIKIKDLAENSSDEIKKLLMII